VLAPQGIGVQVPSSAPIHILKELLRVQVRRTIALGCQCCDRLVFSPNHAVVTLYEGHSSMKIEKYLLLVLVIFALIVIGTILHKIIH
jgi:hypothetical protein